LPLFYEAEYVGSFKSENVFDSNSVETVDS